jgi:hypothetical protein
VIGGAEVGARNVISANLRGIHIEGTAVVRSLAKAEISERLAVLPVLPEVTEQGHQQRDDLVQRDEILVQARQSVA